jgi:L-glyceraldehyde 3-phosphate reductase
MAQFALRFALSERRIDTLLVGVSERAHLDEALAASKAGGLDEALLRQIAQRFRELYEMA